MPKRKEMNMEDLVNNFSNSLEDEFKKLRSIHYNPNVKGGGYEKILKEFLETYLGNVFTFDSRVALIDTNHDIFQLLKPSQNEFDIVVQYRTTFPSKVYTYKNIHYISYDSCAFVIEVAQTLTKKQLQDDLNKLRILTVLNKKLGWLDKGKRFDFTVGGPYNVDYPLRVLFYYEASISRKEFTSALEKEIDSWDVLVLLKEKLLLLNSQLPAVIKKPPALWVTVKENALLWLFQLLADSLPYPLIVDAFGPFRKVLFKNKEK